LKGFAEKVFFSAGKGWVSKQYFYEEGWLMRVSRTILVLALAFLIFAVALYVLFLVAVKTIPLIISLIIVLAIFKALIGALFK
jgi:hypothetical protein